MGKISRVSIFRVLDANLNRTTEGLRVCEEVIRFLLNDRELTAKFKEARHRILKITGAAARKKYIETRDSKADVGRKSLRGELKRSSSQDIFFANMQRVKESVRVLEEFYKLIDIKAAVKLKRIRYQAYEIEKKAALKLPAISDIR
ncbi:MAG: thiamine-phosphate pyrophosphorylase [Candidatus Omnitrophota bacterium]